MKKFALLRILEVVFAVPLASYWLATVIISGMALGGVAALDWHLPYILMIIGGVLTVVFACFTVYVDISRWKARVKAVSRAKNLLPSRSKEEDEEDEDDL